MKILKYLKYLVTERIIKKLQRTSIGIKIFLSFLLLFLIIMISINLLILNYQKSSLKNQINTNITVLLENVSKDVIDHLVFFDPLAIDEKISIVMNNPGIDYIMLADKNGKIVGHSDKSQLGSYIKMEPSIYKRWQKSDTDGINHINLPVIVGDSYFGILRVGISEDKINAYIEQSTRNLKNYIYILSLIFFF